MIYFRCPACSGPVRATDDQAGLTVDCGRCGHAVACPRRETPKGARAGHGVVKTIAMGALVVALGVMAWAAWAAIEATPEPVVATLSPADVRQRELLAANVSRPGEPDLLALFAEINTRHFAGRLPDMPVIWESRLAEVGDLAHHAFTLEGMFGHLGSHTAILMNTSLREDRAALRRALSHEMVHAYLYEIGDRSTNHGPAFRLELQRLSGEGAFEGIVASDQERQSLREWLDAESAHLDEQGAMLERESEALRQERTAIEEAIATLGTRPAFAADGRGPGGVTIDDLNARREAYNRRVQDAAGLAEQGRNAIAAFNRQVERYNLMLVYPDGMDDAERIAPRASK